MSKPKLPHRQGGALPPLSRKPFTERQSGALPPLYPSKKEYTDQVALLMKVLAEWQTSSEISTQEPEDYPTKLYFQDGSCVRIAVREDTGESYLVVIPPTPDELSQDKDV